MASIGSAVRSEDIRDSGGNSSTRWPGGSGLRFARSETRDRVRAYLVGLLGPPSGRTPGRSPSRSATPTPTACST